VSEAVTNATQHPQKRRRPWVDVEGKLVDDLVTVPVRDYGGWNAVRCEMRAAAASG
jgi:anti-sigma regulatory factor (Ser/Thr protein kinase)